ncbi:hypothetical protein CIK76_05185 [Glutamicibacter sp. BW80]|nr:hypothetical protein CIK76_05185 [Glutamicibacter sp. BW80]
MSLETEISFIDLLELLGLDQGKIAVQSKLPGERLIQRIIDAERATSWSEARFYNRDLWFGINELKPEAKGRAKADIARLTALFADLDVKEGCFSDIEHAKRFLATLEHVYGRPADVLIYSGNGLQPIWLLEDTPERRDRQLMEYELKKFGELAQDIAKFVFDAELDPVFDTARILRVPGTLNHKSDPAKPTKAVLLNGGK